jgi:hypothetical protein
MTRTLFTGRPASGRRGLVVQGAVTTVLVVVGEIGAEGPSPPAGAAEGGGVRPFGKQGADETFRLANGLGVIGLSEALADPKVQGGDAKRGGTAGAAVGGQEALHDDALRRVPGHGAPQEAGRGGFRRVAPRRRRAGNGRRCPRRGRTPSRCHAGAGADPHARDSRPGQPAPTS